MTKNKNRETETDVLTTLLLSVTETNPIRIVFVLSPNYYFLSIKSVRNYVVDCVSFVNVQDSVSVLCQSAALL